MGKIEIVDADLSRPDHQRAVLDMIDAYALDPMGMGRHLPVDVREALIPALREHPTTVILLAFDGARVVGTAICFRGFSTFVAKPLLNIHDLAVVPSYRGRGVGRLLLEAAAVKARALGCCKLTLEVLEDNLRARAVYRAAGFGQGQTGASSGSLFLSKPL